MSIISLNNVTKKFKSITAVNAISLSVDQGEFVALLGPNGAGKTTLLEMIENIQTPTSGTIRLFGRDWATHERDIQRRIGLCLQETQFMDKVTVREILCLFASFYGLPDSRADEILRDIHLEDKQKSYIENLSGGQRQRVAIGISLLNKPELLLLDEPSTGLDPVARREIWDLILALKKQGMTLILTTHYMDEAAYLCGRIVMVNKGEILCDGTLEDLLAAHAPGDSISMTLDRGPLSVASLDALGVHTVVWDEGNRKGLFHVPSAHIALPLLLDIVKANGASILSLETHKATLEDLFLVLTGERLVTA